MTNKNLVLNPERILSQTLDELRITDNKIKQNTSSLMKNLATSDNDEFWINIMKSIVVTCDENNYIFSKAELCDFLTIGARGLDSRKYETKMNSENQLMNKVVSDAIFSIYKDIMENYDTVDDDHRNYYPKIILNVISIIRTGHDIRGEKVNLYGLERYYLKNKHYVMDNKLDVSGPSVSLVEDLQKTMPIVEKELGRKLNERQLQHATISIRKVKTYVENVLDGKFIPHGSHGINHVKHNLEYGYQLMGLIEYRRRKYSQSYNKNS